MVRKWGKDVGPKWGQGEGPKWGQFTLEGLAFLLMNETDISLDNGPDGLNETPNKLKNNGEVLTSGKLGRFTSANR